MTLRPLESMRTLLVCRGPCRAWMARGRIASACDSRMQRWRCLVRFLDVTRGHMAMPRREKAP
jgi:hypothetical protein